MKKNKVKTILIILIILILCLNIGVYAAYVLSATEVSYTKSDGTTTVSVKEALDELYANNPLASKVSVGDYVAYNATNNYSYESPKGTCSSHGNGYGAQKFTSSSSIKWRVLGWDELTGGVMLISEAPILTDAGAVFYMKGGIGYLYAEQELNTICTIYGHGTGANTSKKFNYETGDVATGTTVGTITGSGARSINVDDINAITGYTPTIKTAYTHSIYYPTTTTTTGYSEAATSRTDIDTSYSYTGSTYLDSTSEIYKMLFKNTSNSDYISYWLASRCVKSYSNVAHFYARDVLVGNVNNQYTLCSGTSVRFFEDSTIYGVRPVVYLKSTIQTSGKNSSGAWTIIDK